MRVKHRLKNLLLVCMLFLGACNEFAYAQSYELLTDPLRPFLDTDGNPLALGKLRTCAAGATCTCTTTSSALTTYSDSSGTPNTNPVILDSTGKATVYGSSSSYKLALCTSADVSIKTQDNVIAVGLASLNQFNHTTNVLPKFGGSNTLSTTQLTDDGTKITLGTTTSSISPLVLISRDSSTAGLAISSAAASSVQTRMDFYKSRGTHASPANVQASDGTWGIEGFNYSGGSYFQGATISSIVSGAVTSGQSPPSDMEFYTNAANGSPTLRLTLTPAGAATFTGRIQGAQGTDTASANNLTLPSNGNIFVISGATQINLIDTTNWQNGSKITLQFSGAPTVKNNQSTSTTFSKILLSGSVDFVASANDMLTLVLVNSIWYEISRTVI